MIFEKFDFSPPSEEEIKVVKEIAKYTPEELDGREMWILRNFVEDDYE